VRAPGNSLSSFFITVILIQDPETAYLYITCVTIRLWISIQEGE